MHINSRWVLLFVILSLISIFFFPSTSYASTSWMKYHRKDTLLNTYMRAYATEGERLWVGTYGDGIVIYDGKSTKNMRMSNTGSMPGKSDGLVSDLVTCISIDEKNGKAWVGTYQGLSACDLQGTNWERFTEKEGLANNVVRDVVVDDNGFTWVATPSGVCKYDGEKWEVFNVKKGMEDENIQSLKVCNGTVWAATVGGTVCRFDGTEWKKLLYR